MDNKENTDTKTRQYDNFDNTVWKVDKTWQNIRKSEWPVIKETLNHLHSLSLNGIDTIRFKKDYKYIKQFYLAGFIEISEETDGISNDTQILSMISPLDIVYVDSGPLLECWLTPEPSIQKWKEIMRRYDVNLPKEYPHPTSFEVSRKIYRRALLEWYAIAERNNVFNKLEPELSIFFKAFSDSKDYKFSWEELLGGFLYSCGWSGRELTYNSKHPVFNTAKQIVSALIPFYLNKNSIIKGQQQNSSRKLKYYLGKNEENYRNIFSVLNYISRNNQKKYGSKQVKLASDLLIGFKKLDLPATLYDSLTKARGVSENEESMLKILKKGSHITCC